MCLLLSRRFLPLNKNHVLQSKPQTVFSFQELVFSASPDATIRIWSVPSASCVQVVRAHESAVTGLSLHATGDYLLSSSDDQVRSVTEGCFSTLCFAYETLHEKAPGKCGQKNCLTLFFISCIFPPFSTGPFLTSKLAVFSPRSQMKLLVVVRCTLYLSLVLLVDVLQGVVNL